MTAEKAERFLEEKKSIQRLLTPSAMYVVRTSKYNPNARSMSVANAKAAQMLTTADTRDVEAEKATTRAKITETQEASLQYALPFVAGTYLSGKTI